MTGVYTVYDLPLMASTILFVRRSAQQKIQSSIRALVRGCTPPYFSSHFNSSRTLIFPCHGFLPVRGPHREKSAGHSEHSIRAAHDRVK